MSSEEKEEDGTVALGNRALGLREMGILFFEG